VTEAIGREQWEVGSFTDQFFEKLLKGDFEKLNEVIGDGLLASYLLGVDQVTNESSSASASFADPIQLGFDVESKEAIDYFKKKRVVTRKKFDLLADDSRSAAFTVSGVYKTDVINGFKSEITKALEAGTAQSKVIKRFKEIVKGAGHEQLGAFHLETIFRTNMQMAYGVGRRKTLEDVSNDLPFWTYHDVGDDRVRETHHALNGMILPANHPFWTAHFPPWDFNCRCSVTATDEISDGYDHSSPGGDSDVRLFYDESGMPAKAEVGTSVFDLAAEGKFQGVPPQGGLKEVIESGVERAKQSRRKK
jgi:SPP1 gp7 family putative phage head morphogenesis protein